MARRSERPAGGRSTRTLLRPVRPDARRDDRGARAHSVWLPGPRCPRPRTCVDADPLPPTELVSVSYRPFPAFRRVREPARAGTRAQTVTDVVLLAFRVGAERDELARTSSTRCGRARVLRRPEHRLDPRNAARRLVARQRLAPAARRGARGARAAQAAGGSWLVGGHGDLWRDALVSSAELVEILDAMDRIGGLRVRQNKVSTASKIASTCSRSCR